jgi:hypothetical protein
MVDAYDDRLGFRREGDSWVLELWPYLGLSPTFAPQA